MGVQLTVTGIQSARAVKSRSLTHLAEGLLVGVGGNLFGDGDADVSAVGLAREDVDAGLPCGEKERKREVSKYGYPGLAARKAGIGEDANGRARLFSVPRCVR